MTSRLTSKQKWQLAIKLLLTYSPLLFYLNMPEKGPDEKLINFLPFFILLSAIGLGMYFVWITATDSLQRYLFERFGLEIILDSGWKSLALTILISLGLSVLYIFTFQLITRSIALVLFPILEHYNIPHGPSQFPEVLDYLHRANNGLSVAIMISMFYLVVNPRSHQQIKDIQLQTERQGKVAAMSQFEALKNQLSPHFLFNSLSILTSLVLMLNRAKRILVKSVSRH